MAVMEGGPEMPHRLCRLLEPDPVRPQDAECPGTHYVSQQGFKTVATVQGMVGLVEVEEDGMDDHLPHDDDLLKHVCLNGGNQHSSPHLKYM